MQSEIRMLFIGFTQKLLKIKIKVNETENIDVCAVPQALHIQKSSN